MDAAERDDWQEHAACRYVDPDLFFPARGASVKEAKAVCNGSITTNEAGDRVMVPPCPVRAQCLEAALANGEKHGIWGGLSERERRRLRASRRRSQGLVDY